MTRKVTGQAKRWRLQSLTIRDFRGISGSCTLDFACRPCLIHGDNGMGKSTIALALQWTIFGCFPDGVLVKKLSDKFMSPVGGELDAWYGQVCFARDGRQLIITRDEAQESFTLQIDGKTYRDEKAEERREDLLSLDMDTFVRAVLLQQGRIRGLLLDEVKERNKALDRLLGMETAEILLEHLKKKGFQEAAEAWREHSRQAQDRLKNQQEYLKEQLKEAEGNARERRFMGKHLNLAGLRTAYDELGAEVVKVGKKQGMKTDQLAPVDSVKAAETISRTLAKALQSIRLGSEGQQRLAPINKRLLELSRLRDEWEEVVDARNGAQAEVDALVKKHGDQKILTTQIESIQKEIPEQEKQLRSADQLRKLLAEAHAYVVENEGETCPVCEQPLPARKALEAGLKGRLDKLSSKAIEEAERRLAKSLATLESLQKARKAMAAAERVRVECQDKLEKRRKQVVEALGGTGLAEKMIASQIEKVVVAQQTMHREVSKGVEGMEEELEKISDRNNDIQAALLPVIKLRDDQVKCEKRIQTAKQAHATEEKNADAMDALATDVERIRKAVLEAKDEIASDRINKAGPRAQELYAALVNHPLFDRIEIKTSPKANKVDYSFEVSASKVKNSAREARLVLSDGQLTAAAQALLYALAESSSHGLDLVYLDDPTQNLDHSHKEAMARIIAKLAENTQVIVSTQDEDFVTLLDDADFKRSAVVHELKDWDRKPEVKTTRPMGGN